MRIRSLDNGSCWFLLGSFLNGNSSVSIQSNHCARHGSARPRRVGECQCGTFQQPSPAPTSELWRNPPRARNLPREGRRWRCAPDDHSKPKSFLLLPSHLLGRPEVFFVKLPSREAQQNNRTRDCHAEDDDATNVPPRGGGGYSRHPFVVAGPGPIPPPVLVVWRICERVRSSPFASASSPPGGSRRTAGQREPSTRTPQ
jgi:hypothetical protein